MPAMFKAFVLVGFLLTISAGLGIGGDKKAKSQSAAANAPPQMDDDKRIVHALNRFTFGVRPGEVERVRAVGLDKWLDQQLHPDRIDDSATEARLAPFRTLKMSTREMVENFPPPQVLKAVENGRMSMPSDPAKRAVYQSRILAMQEQQEKKEWSTANTSNSNAGPNNNDKQDPAPDMKDMQSDPEMKANPPNDGKPAAKTDAADPKFALAQKRHRQQLEADMYADLASDQLLQQPPDQRYKSIMKMTPLERLDLTKGYRGPRAMQLVEGMKPEQQETIEAIMNPQLVVGGELSQAKLLRSIYSARQLEELLTGFWNNHFNVFVNKGPDRYMITAYERDVIRPHVLGKFKDLLLATAKSPAMLLYLDNLESVGPHSHLAMFCNQRPQIRRRPLGAIH